MTAAENKGWSPYLAGGLSGVLSILSVWSIFTLIIISLRMALTTPAYAQKATIELTFEKDLIEARKVSNELAESVRGLLLKEIEKGGFSSAIRVCSELAQEITNQLSSRTALYIRRVSLRYRNPKNVPDDYERRKLEEFDRLNREKKLSNEYFEVVKEEGKEYLRYFRPLITAPLCITCHGPEENIPSEVKSILSKKYPDDRATGFLVGGLRGAISVKIPVAGGKK